MKSYDYFNYNILFQSITCAVLCLVFFFGIQGCKSSFGSSNDLKSQIAEIMEIWPGTYTNAKQIDDVIESGGKVWRLDDSGEGGYLHITSHYVKINLPDVGQHVLYVEEYRDDAPEETYRQRIYTLDINEEAQEVRVKMWPFKDKEKYVGAWKDAQLLQSISKDDINPYPDICDLRVRQERGKYYMVMNGSDCTFGTKTFNYEVMLEENRFNYRDKITDSSDGSVTSAAAFAYHHLDRIRK